MSTTTTDLPRLDHLATLEAEAVTVMREVAAEFERPVLLFSGGKDSIVLLRLADLAETAASRVTERGQTRSDDRASAASMEDRKRQGYF